MEELKRELEKKEEELREKEKTSSEGELTYTTILHRARKKLGISMNDYAVADIIFKMGGMTKSRGRGGWVYASKKNIADNLRLSRATIFRSLNTLEEKGLIERNKETSEVRTTKKWEDTAVFEKHQIRPKRRA